jgi:5-bromo-4-chloroindolyl phosphate hydrolysis protein
MKTMLFAVIISGGTFLLFYFGLSNTGLPISFGISVAAFIAALLASPFRKPAPANKTRPEEKPAGSPAKTNQSAPDDLIAEGNRRIAEILENAKRIKSQEIKDKIAAIVEISGRIFEDLRQDPSDVKKAKKFVLYYLDSTSIIVKKYADLSKYTYTNPEMNSTLKRAENLLDSIKEAFEKQLLALLENDVMDLDVEIKTLESTFKMDGY